MNTMDISKFHSAVCMCMKRKKGKRFKNASQYNVQNIYNTRSLFHDENQARAAYFIIEECNRFLKEAKNKGALKVQQ